MSKIKAIDPKIIVNRDVDRPYYSIEYYDTSDNKWHIGYGSYELKNVIEWLDTDFDVIKADVAPVRHRRWVIIETLCGGGKERKYFRCSECNKANVIRSNYCPNCGARMDGDPDANGNDNKTPET